MILQSITDDLARLYQMDAAPPVAPWLVSRARYRRYCTRFAHLDPQRAEMLLLVPQSEGIDVGLYIAPEVTRRLQQTDPRTQLDQHNLAAACVAIEGISHFLCVWWKWSHELPCSLLELELQAEIDKYLLCRHWLRAQGNPGNDLLGSLFEHYALAGGMDAEAAERYHRANALAHHFCHTLAACRTQEPAVQRARAFYRLTHWQKLRWLVASDSLHSIDRSGMGRACGGLG
ncbi:MAG: hypothetical protein HY696_05320 [Deltaproteobacteria bacterium]|nr:hypothetical protein [Deltaproteobacteria bacterium]